MSISDGMPVNAATINNNTMSKNVDNTAAGVQTFSNTTQSTDKDTGAVILEGGLGVEKNINSGGNIAAVGTVSGSNLSGTNTGNVTAAAVGSTPNANGLTITGQAINLEPADATNPGVMTTAAQSFAGIKTFEDLEAGLRFRLGFDVDSATTGANALLPEPTAPIYVLTNASLTSIDRIDSNESLAFILVNRTGADVDILNEVGSPANQQIITGTGADITLANNAAIWLTYESDTAKWQVVGGSGAGGTGVIADTMANILGLARVAGALYFATDELAYYGDNGTDVVPLDVVVDTLANIQGNYTFVAGKLYYASDENRFYYSDGSSEYVLGPLTEDSANAGSPGQVLSHDATSIAKFKNPFNELSYYIQTENISGNNSGNNSLYADGAADPVDASGGSPTATITTSSSNPIAPSNAMNALNQIFTPGTLGDGVRTLSGEIQRCDYGKIFKLVFDYHIASGTYTDGDIGLYILDSSNNKLMLQPTHLIPNAVGQSRFEVYFQMPVLAVATALQDLKVCLHQRTSATGYTVAFNWKIIEAFSTGYAPISTDPEEFDSSAGVFIKAVTTDPAYGTVVRNEGRYSNNAGMTYYTWEYEQSDNTGASNGSGTYLIKLPYKMDLTKYGLAQNFTDTGLTQSVTVDGDGSAYYAGGDNIYRAVFYVYDEQHLAVLLRSTTGTYNWWSSSFFQFSPGAPALKFQYHIKVWTLGLSAETKVISEYDGRVVALIAQGNPASASAGNPIIFPTATKDTHSAYNTTTGEYTVKVAGFYKMHGSVNSGAAGGSLLFAYKNGVSYSGIGAINSNGGGAFSGLIEAAVGDVLTLRCDAAIDSDGQASLNIDMLSGSQQISAGERVIEKGYYPFGTSVTSGTAIGGLTKTFSSNGALNFTSGVFTAPRSDWYRVKFCMHCGATVTPFSIYVNGAQDAELFISNSGALGGGNDTVYLLADDTLEIRSSVSATSANGGAGGRQYLEIMSGAW